MISEKILRKRIQESIFGELSDELLNRIWSVYRYCNIFWTRFFFLSWYKKIVKWRDAHGNITINMLP